MFLSIRTVIITKQNNQKLPHLTKMRKHIIFSLILSLSCLTGYAKTIQTPKDDGEFRTVVFDGAHSTVPYRIPAITETRKGTLLAVCDYRLNHSDIGSNLVRLCLRCTWQ